MLVKEPDLESSERLYNEGIFLLSNRRYCLPEFRERFADWNRAMREVGQGGDDNLSGDVQKSRVILRTLIEGETAWLKIEPCFNLLERQLAAEELKD